ncbi:DUF4859 domain-containing protein [Mangrovibacterium lignilyticum]|uniref:DUF4859 domain-containing protein n=1 Tax=Mangrovibacterium lignilyticum TaxID=2668052 RepID=UPI0013CF919C|nr:DUF4859 domain-containing protein [Mangrovibacterium lignilyticum]
MNKIYLYIILCILTAGFISCEDNADFSSLHELTADEIAEIARQDSIEEAAKNKINANLVLEYSVDITTSGTLYDGVSLPIDIDQIAELFGLTEEEVLAGIAEESGAPEIKGFAMEGETHSDVASATNTNSTWGHWWDADNKITTWGETAMVFAEFDYETGEFAIGQYPGHLEDGQTLEIIEALKYNELRVAVVVTINAKAPGQVSAEVVSTQNISVDVYPRLGYDADSIEFDLDQALTDLGVSSIDEVSFIGVNEDGSYNQEPVIDGVGFWYDLNGYVGSWGENASFYTYYGEFSDNEISIGQFPGNITEEQTYDIKYGIFANNKIVMLDFAITVVPYTNPETAPTGDPQALSSDITLSKAYGDDYASVQADIKETLRDAFKMTTYEISRAIMTGELKLYQGAITETDPEYTSDVPGYWLTAEGTAGGWGESLVWCSIGYTETELYLYGGNHPANAVAGNSVSTTYIATLNGGSVTFNITFNID